MNLKKWRHITNYVQSCQKYAVLSLHFMLLGYYENMVDFTGDIESAVMKFINEFR